MPVLGALRIAIGRVIAKELPSLPLHGKGGLDLDGELPDVVIVHNVGKGDNGTAIPMGVLQAVYVIQDGDDPDALLRKVFLHEAAQLRVIPAQTGVVFENHTVNNSRLNVPHHALILRAVKVSARVAVIGVNLHGGNLLSLVLQVFDILLDDSFLVLDTVAFQFVPVLFAEADIDRYVPLDDKTVAVLFFVPHKGHRCSLLLKPLIFAEQYLHLYCSKYEKKRQTTALFDRCAERMETRQDSRLGPLRA